MIFWAFSFIWFKTANETYRPVTIVFIRLVLSVVLLNIFISASRSRIRIKKEDRKLFIILAVFEPFLYFLGESFGLTYVNATTGSVIISTIPVIAAIGAWILFREKLKPVNYAGIIISFIGILVFLLNRYGSLSYDIRGILLMTFAVFSAVGYNLVLSRLVGSYDPICIVNIQNMIGALLFLPVFLVSDLQHFISTPLQAKALMPVVKLAVFASCGAFILFVHAVKQLGVARANVFTNCIPLFTAIFSFFLLGDTISLKNIAGIAIVIAGLFMSQFNGRSGKSGEAMVLTGKTA
jgi:drug/metabolite transporter (DMT)-like permease